MLSFRLHPISHMCTVRSRTGEELCARSHNIKPRLLDSSLDKETELRFEELLVFVTGSDEVPVLGFPEKLSIHFYQPERKGLLRLPYTSTCMMGLFLPRGVRSCAELHMMLLRAVRDSTGFGKA